MDKQQEHLDTLREIRTMMERSSRFISLSGLSGVIAGGAAIAGVLAAWYVLDLPLSGEDYYLRVTEGNGLPGFSFKSFLIADAVTVLLVSLVSAIALTIRKAHAKKLPVWDKTAKRLLANMMIPLLAGGIFCLTLMYHNQIIFIAPSMLIFYGLALFNAGKYTLDEVRYLGMAEVVIGLIAALFINFGLLLWVLGFGVLHFIYGIAMYFRYER